MKLSTLALVGAVVVLAGCSRTPVKPASSLSSSIDTSTAAVGVPVAGFEGLLLAGFVAQSPYLTFTQADYERARADGKVILLDFFANWCPICLAETPELVAGFAVLASDRVVGFRVNYNDDETDAAEKALARQFGVTYQHTKVVLVDGKEALRQLEAWDRHEFARNLAPFLK